MRTRPSHADHRPVFCMDRVGPEDLAGVAGTDYRSGSRSSYFGAALLSGLSNLAIASLPSAPVAVAGYGPSATLLHTSIGWRSTEASSPEPAASIQSRRHRAQSLRSCPLGRRTPGN